MWRSEDEMLERVAHRARALRTHRQARVLGTLAGAVALAGIASAALVPGSGPGEGQRIEVVAPSTTVPTASPTTKAATRAPSPLPTVSPPTTVAAHPDGSFTTPPLAATGPGFPAGPTSTSPTPSFPDYDDCTAADFQVELILERDTFRVGEVVRATIRAENISDRTCGPQSGYRVAWLNAESSEELAGVALAFTCGPECSVHPGEVLGWTHCWDQRVQGQPGVAVGPGSYEVEMGIGVGHGLVQRATFEIVDLPPTSTTFPVGC